MTEGHQHEEPPESGTENTGTSDILEDAGRGGEGTSPADGTPRIEGEAVPGQTQSPAADDDVGVPDELDERTD